MQHVKPLDWEAVLRSDVPLKVPFLPASLKSCLYMLPLGHGTASPDVLHRELHLSSALSTLSALSKMLCRWWPAVWTRCSQSSWRTSRTQPTCVPACVRGPLCLQWPGPQWCTGAGGWWMLLCSSLCPSGPPSPTAARMSSRCAVARQPTGKSSASPWSTDCRPEDDGKCSLGPAGYLACKLRTQDGLQLGLAGAALSGCNH